MDFFKRAETTYDITINGTRRQITFERNRGGYVLCVDGEERETFKPSNFLTASLGDLNDYKTEIDGVSVVIAARFGKVRVAVDGVYTDNGEEFKAVLPFPVWGSVFVVAPLVPPILFESTFWDIIIAVCFVYTCTHYILKNPDLKAGTPKRIVYCVLVTLTSWAFFGMFLYFSGGIKI